MTDAPKDTCVICGVPEAPSVAFEKGYDDGYKRGLEDAAKIVEYHAGICTDRHDRRWLGDIADLIRAKIGERDDG